MIQENEGNQCDYNKCVNLPENSLPSATVETNHSIEYWDNDFYLLDSGNLDSDVSMVGITESCDLRSPSSDEAHGGLSGITITTHSATADYNWDTTCGMAEHKNEFANIDNYHTDRLTQFMLRTSESRNLLERLAKFAVGAQVRNVKNFRFCGQNGESRSLDYIPSIYFKSNNF